MASTLVSPALEREASAEREPEVEK